MATAQAKWIGWLVALVVLAAVGSGLWYAHAHGHLAPAEAWVHHLVSKGGAGKPDSGGMDMNMPGMNMGTMAASEKASPVPGHAEVNIPYEVQQQIGVTFGRVEMAPLRMSVRTVGILQPDETKVARIHLRTEGWVAKLFVNFTGQQVKKGDPLLSIYSPEFLTTQQEYLNARQGQRSGSELTDQSSLAQLARQRLELWGVSRQELEELDKSRKPQTNLILRSPLTGIVLEKKAFEAIRVTPQDELYVVADLSTIWVQAKVYEYELPHVELGQPATVTLPALPEKKLTGKVVFLQPTVEEKTRTIQVRVELPNKDGLLRPGMFANVEIQHTMGEGLLVPTSAVIRTGERDIAFHVMSSERFMPVEVKIGSFQFGDRFQILEGLKAGDKVVTSANFLIDSESRLRVGGMGGMPGMPGMDMGEMKGKDQKGDMKMDHKKGMEGMDHDKMKH
jgi:Cu(I)/Ag(I) efflux system membrane fusion protein